MKVGTLSSGAYWVRGNKPLIQLKGKRIKFKPQWIDGAKWEDGIITGFSLEMPLVERF